MLLTICARNSLVTGEFPAQRPVTRSFGVFFDLHLNKSLSKQSWRWRFETPSRLLWHHCNRYNKSRFHKRGTKFYIMKIKSGFALKSGVIIGPQNQRFRLKKGCFSRPESTKRGYFSSLGTSGVYVLVKSGWTGAHCGLFYWWSLLDIS